MEYMFPCLRKGGKGYAPRSKQQNAEKGKTPMTNMINQQWILKTRPKPGPLTPELFGYREAPVPSLKAGEYLVAVELLSFDPTQRMWMTIDSYIPQVPLGSVMRALGLGTVIASQHPDFPMGARVTGLLGWQKYALRTGSDYFPDSLVPEGLEASAALSIFGLTGLTAYFGMVEVGRVKAGQVVLVSGAAGATGSVAAQIAKNLGATKVIGIAGGKEKCRWLLEHAKLDAAIDYKHEHIAQRLSAEAPEGIDLYFDNVGGPTLDCALAHLRRNAQVVLCGGISIYEGAEGAISNYMNLVIQRATMRGFLFSDHLGQAATAVDRLGSWLTAGKLVYEIDMQHGFTNIPATLQRLFTGKNLGKQLLRLDF